ncbi:MAG: PepSY domain-containing protein [Mariprofundus sp.]|nr:PepSY domain-containing protein [Mariprofundus sp.]
MKIAYAFPALVAGRIKRQSEMNTRMMGARLADRLIRVLTLLMLCVGASGSAFADDVDCVRQLRSTGSILPLTNILSKVEHRYPGTLLDVELEDEKGVIFYEIELLGPDHIIRTIKVDARSGQIIASEQD